MQTKPLPQQHAGNPCNDVEGESKKIDRKAEPGDEGKDVIHLDFEETSQNGRNGQGEGNHEPRGDRKKALDHAHPKVLRHQARQQACQRQDAENQRERRFLRRGDGHIRKDRVERGISDRETEECAQESCPCDAKGPFT